TILPASNQSGVATITVTVADGNGSAASQSFLLKVNPVNDPPTLDAIPSLILNENPGAQSIRLTGISSGATNETQTLLLSASSSDPAVVPNPSISYTNSGTNGTLTFTPIPGAHGAANITVTVNDGQSQNNL